MRPASDSLIAKGETYIKALPKKKKGKTNTKTIERQTQTGSGRGVIFAPTPVFWLKYEDRQVAEEA